MKIFISFLFVFYCISFLILSDTRANEIQVIAGAGPSTSVVQLFFEKFKDQPISKGYTFKIPPKSTKHAGGIKGSDKYIFGRTGRPLNDNEKKQGKEEIYLGRVPVAFAVGSDVMVSTLTLSQLEMIFTGKVTTWKKLGGTNNAIATIGREPNEALFSVVKIKYPFFNQSKFKFVVKKDNHVVDLLKKPQGKFAIGFGSKPNFEKASIKTIAVEDFSAGVSLGLVYDKKNKKHALVDAVKSYAKSNKWADEVKSIGMMPPQ